MTDVLDTIERELVGAIERRNRRRRRRRALGLFSGLALGVGVAAGAGAAAVLDPIDAWLGGDGRPARPAGAPRVDLAARDDDGVRWSVATYRNALGQIATATAPAGVAGRRGTVAGRSGFAIAHGLLRSPLAGAEVDVVRVGGRRHYLVAGTVAEGVERVVVELGGERRVAQLAGAAVGAGTEPPGELTAAGERLAERLPERVLVRTYAAAFTPDAVTSAHARPVVETWVPGAAPQRQTAAEACVSERCGRSIPRAPGPGRAG